MKKYIQIGLQVLLALFFIAMGVMKLMGDPMIVESFERFGYPSWFMLLIGVAEITGGLGMLVGSHVHKAAPKLAVLGLMLIMVGAFVSHVLAGDTLSVAIPAAVAFVLLGAYLKLLKRSAHTEPVPDTSGHTNANSEISNE